jgi:hypothetical protein
MISHKYIILQGFFVILLLMHYLVKYGHTWAAGLWMVLVLTGPLCPLAHSRLIFVTPICWLEFLQMILMSFPRVLFGLAVLIWAQEQLSSA